MIILVINMYINDRYLFIILTYKKTQGKTFFYKSSLSFFHWSHFILTISLRNPAEQSNSNLNFWGKFVCLGLPFLGAWRETHQQRVTKKELKIFFGLHFFATSFGKLVKQKVIQNWKRKNFCKKRFYLDFHVSYDIVHEIFDFRK